MTDTSPALTLEQAKIAAAKVPAFLRNEASLFAGDQSRVEKMDNIPRIAPYFTVVGVGLGAVLGGTIALGWVKGAWRWVTGAMALGSAVTGMYAGMSVAKEETKIYSAIKHALPRLKQALTNYADTIEKDPGLQLQIAQYAVETTTLNDVKTRGIDEIVGGKALIFGQTAGYIDTKRLSDGIAQKVRCEMNPKGKDCATIVR